MGFSQPTNITFGAPSWMLEFILRFQLRSSPKTGATVLRRNISTRTTFALAWPCLHGSKKRQQQWVKKGLYMAYKPLTIPWMHIRPRSWRPSMWWSLHCWDLGGGSHAMPCPCFNRCWRTDAWIFGPRGNQGGSRKILVEQRPGFASPS